MSFSGTERSIYDRLERSSKGKFKVIPAFTQSPNDRDNNGVASFTDHDDVIEDSRNDTKKQDRIKSWIRVRIIGYLQEYFKTNSGQELLNELQAKCVDRKDVLTATNFRIYLEDENPTYLTIRQHWFCIGPSRK